jgi:hypothetical protein
LDPSVFRNDLGPSWRGVVRPRLFWRLLFAQVLVLASAGGGMIMRLSPVIAERGHAVRISPALVVEPDR